MTRAAFLTLYDYGQGGIWNFLLATSADEIREAYPELEVLSSPPQWMTAEDLRQIQTLDVRDTTSPFLTSLRHGRETG